MDTSNPQNQAAPASNNAVKKSPLIKTSLILGFILFIGIAAFYLLEVQPELYHREKLKSAKEKKFESKEDALNERVKEIQEKESPDNEINLASLVEYSKSIHDPAEISRQEGTLWINPQTSKMICSLGALQGLLPGNYLTVYDNEEKLGQVSVETSFDVISFVQPLDDSLQLLSGKYYRIVKE